MSMSPRDPPRPPESMDYAGECVSKGWRWAGCVGGGRTWWIGGRESPVWLREASRACSCAAAARSGVGREDSDMLVPPLLLRVLFGAGGSGAGESCGRGGG